MRRLTLRAGRRSRRRPGTLAASTLALSLLGGASPQPGEDPQAGPAAGLQSRPAAPAEKHPVFLYIVDGLSAMELPAYGYGVMTAPNLAHLMGEGITFLQSYSVSPWTVPSVASTLTSLYPSAHGLEKAGDRLPRSAKTFAEILKEHGYETALFSAHPLIGSLSGLEQGFDWVEEVPGPFGPSRPRGPADTSAGLNARILAWLDKRTSTAPTFIVAVSSDLLQPFGAPDPEGRQFLRPEELEWFRGVRRKLLAMRPGGLCLATSADLKRLGADPDRFGRAARAVYDGAILYADRQMRALREELEERGLWKKTLFVVTSTHGEELGERGIFGHGASLYDTSVRIPIVISFPPLVPSPRQVIRTSDLVDLLPTVLSMLGLPVPAGLQGFEKNVEHVRGTPGFSDRAAYAETAPAGALPTGRAEMVVDPGHKLIRYIEPPRGLERPELELFDAVDVMGSEKRSIVASSPEFTASKREILAGWRELKGKLQIEPDPAPPPAPPRLREVLRALGYLQGPDPLSRPPSPPTSDSKKAPGNR